MKISVKVNAGSKKEKIELVAPGQYRVHVKAPPEKGKANTALITLLSKHFSTPKSAIRIVSGAGSPNKFLEIKFYQTVHNPTS